MGVKKADWPVVGSEVTPNPHSRSLVPKDPGAEIGGILRKEAHARAEGFAKGERIGSRPGRQLRQEFESNPTTRVAIQENATGKVYRGHGGSKARGIGRDIHSDVWDKHGIDYDSYDQYTDGFAEGREGKFLDRRQMSVKQLSGRIADPKYNDFEASEGWDMRGESHSTRHAERRELESKGAGQKKAELRADSRNPIDQHKRRVRAEKAKLGLKAMKSERRLLEMGVTRESPQALRAAEAASRGLGGSRAFQAARVGRIQQLTRRMGTLKGLARKAGLFSIIGTPFTTGEALSGVNSSDENERLQSFETLLGLPEYSTGRGLSEKEKDMKPIWYDPATGAGKI